MYIEKNVFNDIMNTVMDTYLTKDNDKTRIDLGEYCKCLELNLQHLRYGCLSKPKASYILSST